MDSEKSNLEEVIKYFKNPTLYFPQYIYEYKEYIPNNPGLYAWYFNVYFDLFNFIKIPHMGDVKDWFLLYVGVAGKKSGRTLRDRVYGDHLNQNSKGSTLRFSLAALLWKDIGLNPKKKLKGEEEKKRLNSWIFQHAKVAWIEIQNPEKLETQIIKEYGKCLPLNLKGNKANPCKKELKQLRKEWNKKGSFWGF